MIFIFTQYSNPRYLYKSASSHPHVMAENVTKHLGIAVKLRDCTRILLGSSQFWHQLYRRGILWVSAVPPRKCRVNSWIWLRRFLQIIFSLSFIIHPKTNSVNQESSWLRAYFIWYKSYKFRDASETSNRLSVLFYRQ